MRTINSDIITDTVRQMCTEANQILPPDVRRAIDAALAAEKSPEGKNVLSDIIENYKIAEEEKMPVCQDTGMAVFFAEIGNDVHIEGKPLNEAINDGVAKGYTDGFLRKSIVSDPIERVNTGDNTPAVVHISFVRGDKLKLTIAPKGFGSENMSAIKMLAPSAGIDGVKDFVIKTVSDAGPNPCPPIVVGVGIGGNFESCACMAKRALTLELDVPNPNPKYAALEEELLKRINSLGIGPQGFGGTATALAVKVLAAPTHIAGLPVAVNISCHVTRHLTKII